MLRTWLWESLLCHKCSALQPSSCSIQNKPAIIHSQLMVPVIVFHANLRSSMPTHRVSGSLFRQPHGEKKKKKKQQKLTLRNPQKLPSFSGGASDSNHIVCFCCGIYHKIIGLDIG
jgi:hypothetical protein